MGLHWGWIWGRDRVGTASRVGLSLDTLPVSFYTLDPQILGTLALRGGFYICFTYSVSDIIKF